MGQKQSRDKLMYHYVINGDIDGIQFLSKQGAGLEWKDREGKTPLIVAAKTPGLYEVAKTLVELGANVNAYCRGNHGGTPLHYAAKEGLDTTVALLLSHGANAFVKNRENQTPLDVARKNGRNVVVREIESRICYFAGHIRESYGPGLSDLKNSQSSSGVIWVVVVPRSPHNPPRPPKLELVIYSTPQDAVPRKIVTLRRSNMKAPRFDHPSPSFTVFDNKTKTKYKFSSVSYNDKQQLRRLFNACKGISQVIPATAQMTNFEAISSPLHPTSSQMSSPAWQTPRYFSPPMTPSHPRWVPDSPIHNHRLGTVNWPPLSTQPNITTHISDKIPPPSPAPSAPPITTTTTTATAATVNEVSTSVSDNVGPTGFDEPTVCVVCWEAPVEGACVPCGHVSACMSCLKKIEDSKGSCPVCRAKIDQVVKLYGI